ncbi:uncharacterized protein TrAtP1_000920 [Trichoderma atroviride]|uniref:uncharacterized protein n=1 Tax=Hypocrea atroviridis TaxID=63577 RepID=UPI003332F594|nr:hypothetical protein TrAtP1_000920 [Trichoderma atroviride]
MPFARSQCHLVPQLLDNLLILHLSAYPYKAGTTSTYFKALVFPSSTIHHQHIPASDASRISSPPNKPSPLLDEVYYASGSPPPTCH